MAYRPRSLDDLSQSIRGAIRQYLPGTDAAIRQNVLSVIAKVLALLAREYELRLEWIYRQLFLSTADDVDMVRLHAADYRIYQKPASAAAGTVTGTGAASITYPAGVRFLSAGVTYISVRPFTANAMGVFSAEVRAEASGLATNRDPEARLALADAALYPELSTEVAVGPGGLGGGADVEGIESLRQRALTRKAVPPQGGALGDYEALALAVPGVVAAYARAFTNGVGTVGVWVLFEGRPNGIPTAADLDAVEAAITARRLIRGRFFAVAPVPVPLDLVVAVTPDTAAVRASVTGALKRMLDPTVRGAKVRPGLPGEPFVLTEAAISGAISAAEGEVDHDLVSPSGPSGFQSGELCVLGAIRWV